jgi:hypothetical protein
MFKDATSWRVLFAVGQEISAHTWNGSLPHFNHLPKMMGWMLLREY